MKRMMVAGAVVAAAVTRVDAAPPTAPFPLQPHRIAYEVSLGARPGSTFSSARGVIAVEFTGSACKGYKTQFRQAMQLADADGGQRMLDFAIQNWEGGKGESFRFTVLNKLNGATTREARGEAKRVGDGSISVRLEHPKGKAGDFDGNANFPTAMLMNLVKAAQRGEKRYDSRIFDGSEGGEKVYETVSTIGAALEGEKNGRIEPVLNADPLKDVPRWPVSTSYFDNTAGDRVPVYTMKSITFANGVVGDLQFDFADFSLRARAVRFEALPAETCS
ncbi:MAG: cell envelope integrity EipB family protein [Proteobacteria bacterium]|nr:cell envelope integrity EipB family protein [Pseudomonadota bacterium]